MIFSDNSAVVSIIINKSSKSDRVMALLRHIVYWTLSLNFDLKCRHIPSFRNKIADSISGGQVDYFRQLAPVEQTYSTPIPVQIWSLLIKKPTSKLKHQIQRTLGIHMKMLSVHFQTLVDSIC